MTVDRGPCVEFSMSNISVSRHDACLSRTLRTAAKVDKDTARDTIACLSTVMEISAT